MVSPAYNKDRSWGLKRYRTADGLGDGVDLGLNLAGLGVVFHGNVTIGVVGRLRRVLLVLGRGDYDGHFVLALLSRLLGILVRHVEILSTPIASVSKWFLIWSGSGLQAGWARGRGLLCW